MDGGTEVGEAEGGANGVREGAGMPVVNDHIGRAAKKRVLTNLMELVSKPPVFVPEKGRYALNFHGRVTMMSSKNFQLVRPEDHDSVVLQFGKVGKDDFTMDFQWPLSPFQAFALTLSSFDSKLACE